MVSKTDNAVIKLGVVAGGGGSSDVKEVNRCGENEKRKILKIKRKNSRQNRCVDINRI